MAERLVPLLATQVARVRFPVPARPMFSVEKVALFCDPTPGGTFLKICSSASEGVPHLEAWEYHIQRTA
jgi:hypothetical protein